MIHFTHTKKNILTCTLLALWKRHTWIWTLFLSTSARKPLLQRWQFIRLIYSSSTNLPISVITILFAFMQKKMNLIDVRHHWSSLFLRSCRNSQILLLCPLCEVLVYCLTVTLNNPASKTNNNKQNTSMIGLRIPKQFWTSMTVSTDRKDFDTNLVVMVQSCYSLYAIKMQGQIFKHLPLSHVQVAGVIH